MINNFNNVFSKGFSTIEILMNISFILIIFLIIYIFYWHTINRNIAKLNRCKINLNSQGSIYTIYGKQKQTKLYKIKYDNTDAHNVSVDCVCPAGKMPNKFEVRAYDSIDGKWKKADKYCNCDKYYNINNNNLDFYGDDFLVDNYNKNKNKNLGSIDKLVFPEVI